MSQSKEPKKTLATYRAHCENLEREIAARKAEGASNNEVVQWLIEAAETFTKAAGLIIEIGDEAPAQSVLPDQLLGGVE